MLVSDYLEYAVAGEIGPLSVKDIGEEDPTAIQLANRIKLIKYLNLASIEVHKKFALIQKEFLFKNISNNKLYDIPTDFLYAISASFDDGTEIPINNGRVVLLDSVDAAVSVLFPAPYKALTKGTDRKGRDEISLIYVSSPPDVNAMTDYIDLSNIYTEPILYYMAYKAFGSKDGKRDGENNTYYMRFIESCRHIELAGYVNPDNLDTNVKLNEAGFV